MTNWRAVGIGFVVELCLAVIGLLVPGVGQLVAGLVGGFVAGYIGSTTIQSGLWHGLLAGSLGGFLLAVPIGVLVAVATVGFDLTNQFGGLVVGIGTVTLVLLVATILGANSAIGGAVGGLTKRRTAGHSDSQLEPTAHGRTNRPARTGGETDRAVSNAEESTHSSKLTAVIRDQR